MVMIVIIMLTPNRFCPIIPWDNPIPAIMSATSPLGVMPTPILALPKKLNPVARAGIPDPSTLDNIAKTDKTIPNITALVIEPTSTSIPMTTKNMGTINCMMPDNSFSTLCANSVAESASPIEKAPMIKASPANSAAPAARNAKARVKTKPAPSDRNLFIARSMYGAAQIPIAVKPSQNPIALMATMPIAPAEKLDAALAPTTTVNTNRGRSH